MMKFFYLFTVFLIIQTINARKVQKCFPVNKPQCPKGQIYLEKGPGPFCYATCCGPRGPPCRIDTFTSGCFCENPEELKMFPVSNNSLGEANNPCVSECDFNECARLSCLQRPNEEWRECGPTYFCDSQICRGKLPICDEEEAMVCVSGCFCKKGFMRFNGECIKECPPLP